jgi:hypothetical protein
LRSSSGWTTTTRRPPPRQSGHRRWSKPNRRACAALAGKRTSAADTMGDGNSQGTGIARQPSERAKSTHSGSSRLPDGRLLVGGIRSAERALGEGPKAAFIVRLAVIDSQIFSRTGSLTRRCPTCSSLRRTPPSGPALPGLGGVYLFLPSLSPEALAEDKADHVFLMVGMGCAHAGKLNRARGLRRFS